MARRTLLLILAVVALAWPASASAAEPAQRFDGTSRGGAPVVLHLTATRASYDVHVRGRCSGRTRFDSGLTGRGAEIAKDGRFAAGADGVRGAYAGHRGRYVFLLGARRQAETVRGTVRVSFRSGGFSCATGTVPFVAYLDGSRGAPYRDSRAATGRYTAAGDGISGLRASVFEPARRLESVSFSWRIRCGGKDKVFLTGREVFDAQTLIRGRVVAGGRRSVRLARGRISHEAYRLEVRLFVAGGAYRIAGTWRLRSAITRGDRVVYRCSSPGLKFAGDFRGP